MNVVPLRQIYSISTDKIRTQVTNETSLDGIQ